MNFICMLKPAKANYQTVAKTNSKENVSARMVGELKHISYSYCFSSNFPLQALLNENLPLRFYVDQSL